MTFQITVQPSGHQFSCEADETVLSAAIRAGVGLPYSCNAPWAVWRGATSLVEGVKPDWEHLFLSLRCPVMLVFGERSLPDDDFNRLQQNGVAVKIIPDAGHSMSWENPSALAQALSGFIHGS